MKVKVTEKQVMVTELTLVNQGEYGVNQCEFILPECFDGLCVTAIFNGIPVVLIDGWCKIPALKTGNCVLGVYAYRQGEGETEIMYSPKPTMFFVEPGSFSDEISEESLPKVFDYEIYCGMLRDYWQNMIDSNVLFEYTPDATNNQYYSAKAINNIAFSTNSVVSEFEGVDIAYNENQVYNANAVNQAFVMYGEVLESVLNDVEELKAQMSIVEEISAIVGGAE